MRPSTTPRIQDSHNRRSRHTYRAYYSNECSDLAGLAWSSRRDALISKWIWYTFQHNARLALSKGTIALRPLPRTPSGFPIEPTTRALPHTIAHIYRNSFAYGGARYAIDIQRARSTIHTNLTCPR